ncbi:WD repeat domain phosphoinositide-interacting protein 2 [Pseudolycoriella hygida]|uniref:WD repeat domain phosphoinositide-interacting protein 2 n=1 Tax=Pseudolycoriella hygida TaxID=35572 RepID=A0A9Q0S8S8_9DIPT|nr:WD repeat domain phosphoinositide-interacting protein 2 [Pseudolycoriella hygida]
MAKQHKCVFIAGSTGFSIYNLQSANELQEHYTNRDERTAIAVRLANTHLMAVVTSAEPKVLKFQSDTRKRFICDYKYKSEIQCVKLNRMRVVACTKKALYIHDIKDMKMLHKIEDLPPIDFGLCAFTSESLLAFPISSMCGELQIYDAMNLKAKTSIKAHESPLKALALSPSNSLLATASEKGTVIRIFDVTTGQRLHEFRRGVKRYVSIASLTFSICAKYLCASSNTETVHVFKIDLDKIEKTKCISDSTSSDEVDTQESRWTMGYITKAVSSYLPSPVTDVLTQDRAFATIQLDEAGLKLQCAVVKFGNDTKILAACSDGFLYIYDFDEEKGGECKMSRAHDLRIPLIQEIDEKSMDCDNKNSKPLISNSVQPATISYASVLKGRENDRMSESDRCRDMLEAMCESKSIFDDIHFPPVAVSSN